MGLSLRMAILLSSDEIDILQAQQIQGLVKNPEHKSNLVVIIEVVSISSKYNGSSPEGQTHSEQFIPKQATRSIAKLPLLIYKIQAV
jgi:hypothetical protein